MNKWTDEEAAALVWHTIYPERKKFSEILPDAQKEWVRFVQIARTVFALEAMDEEAFKKLKEAVQL